MTPTRALPRSLPRSEACIDLGRVGTIGLVIGSDVSVHRTLIGFVHRAMQLV
jgi:hypothetical protein